jgi:hypothetical protein
VKGLKYNLSVIFAYKMMLVCYIVGGVLLSLVALYLFLELHYFLRMCLSVIIARFFKKRVKILDDTYIHGKLTLLNF